MGIGVHRDQKILTYIAEQRVHYTSDQEKDKFTHDLALLFDYKIQNNHWYYKAQ